MCFSKVTFGLIRVHKLEKNTNYNLNESILGPCWALLAPLEAKRALKMGQFGTTNGSKTGQNHGFSKTILVQLWCPNR